MASNRPPDPDELGVSFGFNGQPYQWHGHQDFVRSGHEGSEQGSYPDFGQGAYQVPVPVVPSSQRQHPVHSGQQHIPQHISGPQEYSQHREYQNQDNVDLMTNGYDLASQHLPGSQNYGQASLNLLVSREQNQHSIEAGHWDRRQPYVMGSSQLPKGHTRTSRLYHDNTNARHGHSGHQNLTLRDGAGGYGLNSQLPKGHTRTSRSYHDNTNARHGHSGH